MIGVTLTGCGGGAEEVSGRTSSHKARPPTESVLVGQPATEAQATATRKFLAQPQRRPLASAGTTHEVTATVLLDWAERTYPEFFPGHKLDQSLPPYTYRHYPETGNFAGIDGDGNVVILGPISGGAIVNLGKASTFRCHVFPADCNTTPVAAAGQKLSAKTTAVVALDGSASSDADGNLLTYRWTMTSRPAGSTAALKESTSVRPTFTADRSGTYVISLVVYDGLVDSAPALVEVIAVAENIAPVANAGPDQSVTVGATVRLDGRLSTDANGDQLTYRWSLDVRPSGSTAQLADRESATPSYVADKAGRYTASLIVSDGKLVSNVATVSITVAALNAVPVANPGGSKSTVVGTAVLLDGSASYDPDGDAMTYRWTIVSRPSSSAAAIASPTTAFAQFTPDVTGSYVLGLTVGDGRLTSATSHVTITALPPPAPTVELLLYGGYRKSVYLGCLTCNSLHLESICNAYGLFGSSYAVNTIWNDYGLYGGAYAIYSPWNIYSVSAPAILGTDGNFYGYFSANRFHTQRATISWTVRTFDYYLTGRTTSATRNYFCST